MRTLPTAYVHILDRHGLAKFNHPNKDLRRWWRLKFFDRVASDAEEYGLHEYRMFDAKENLLAQGISRAAGE